MKFYETMEGHKILDSKYWPEKLRDYLEKEEDFLVKNIKKDSVILDVGSGEGRHLKLLSNQCKKLFGIDYSRTMVNYSKRILGVYGNICILNEDIKDSNFPEESFDFVICMFNTFGNMNKNTQKAFLEKISRFIKTDGKIFLSVYSENAKDTQIQFYSKIGLVIKGQDHDFVYTDQFISERFTEEKIKMIVESSKLKVIKVIRPNEISYILEIKNIINN